MRMESAGMILRMLTVRNEPIVLYSDGKAIVPSVMLRIQRSLR